MAFPVAMMATCQCIFGAAPCPLMVTSQQQVISGSMPLATISDITLPTFGTCVSPVNPAVAAILSVTGAIVPQPCVPLLTGVWAPGSPTVLIGGKPALNNSSKIMCAYGMISIANPSVMTVQVP